VTDPNGPTLACRKAASDATVQCMVVVAQPKRTSKK